MKRSPPWEAKTPSSNQSFSHISRNITIHYRIHNRPPPVPILIQIHHISVLRFHFLKIHFNIILSLHLSPPRGLSPHQNYVRTSFLHNDTRTSPSHIHDTHTSPSHIHDTRTSPSHIMTHAPLLPTYMTHTHLLPTYITQTHTHLSFLHTCYMHRSSHSSWFDDPNNIFEEYISYSCSLRSFFRMDNMDNCN
jgi:hypothetical protein